LVAKSDFWDELVAALIILNGPSTPTENAKVELEVLLSVTYFHLLGESPKAKIANLNI
jgi:hypothetical protein